MNTLTLPIEPGRNYVRRDGQIITAGDLGNEDTANPTVRVGADREFVFTRTGRANYGGEDHRLDLVADATPA